VTLLYTLFIHLYGIALKLAGRVNPKARLWVAGRAHWRRELEAMLQGADRERNPIVWVHAASLGEFEQGRPIIEAYRESNPGHRIMLTFFSPSGYEVRKNYSGADYVCYLPLDTPAQARRWLDLAQPRFAIFVKYDFWFNFLAALKARNCKVYFVSAFFRPGQYFFSWYGSWFRRQLDLVTWFFVQNEATRALLASIHKENVTVTGDTRFDRVYAIARQKQSFPLIVQFCAGRQVFIGGSTWKEDENLVLPLIRTGENPMKFILAPHDTSPERIRSIAERLESPYLLYSQLNETNAAGCDVLIIDSVGILSQLYQYATLAFIGGGFGAAIHNIQEPITFGVPVFFGPRYHKFTEAVELVEQGGVFCVETTEELSRKVSSLLADPEDYGKISALCRNYVEIHRGATGKIIRYLNNPG